MGLMKNKPGTTTAPAPAAGSTLQGKGKAPAPAPAASKIEKEPQIEPISAGSETANPEANPETTSTSTAVAAAPAAGALVTGNVQMMNHIDTFENRYRVDWNTLIRLQANNGQFINKDDKNNSLGDTIEMQLLSWQDSWQVSPGSDSEEAKQLVRYSSDGTTTQEGENIEAHLQKCRDAGYVKAKLDHRVMLVGVLMGSVKDSNAEGELVQIDLSKTSKQEFDRYRMGTAFKIGRGMLKPEHAEILTMSAEIATNKAGQNWTVVKFAATIPA